MLFFTSLSPHCAATSEADENHCQLSIYSEKVYIYKGKKSKFIWDEAGISLSLPETYCKKDVKLSIKIVNDELVLPSENQGMPLVSALYKITAHFWRAGASTE